jgi:DNA polymerase-3 subunit beta
MKLTISQKELSKAINIVQKAVSTKTPMPILNGILIEAIGNKLYFTATDLELGVKTFVDCDVVEEGSIVVQSRLLGEFIRKLSSNASVIISTDERFRMEIKCLNSEFNISGESAVEYPTNAFDNNGIVFNINSTILKRLIKYTSFAVSQDVMKPVFTGCLFEVKNNKCFFVALDGHRMAVKSEELNLELDEISTIIPSKALNEITKILDEDDFEIEIILSDTHISFNIDKTTIISSLLEGKFIDYNGLIKDEFFTKIKLNTAELRDSVERAALLAREDKNNIVLFNIKENTMQINSVSDIGQAEEFIVLKSVEGSDIKIGFNPKYIVDVLRIIDSEEIEINFLGIMNPCFIKESDNDSFKYMVMPVRTN